jgi:hypothetical protein
MSNNESGGLQDLAAALQDEGSNRPTQAEVAACAGAVRDGRTRYPVDPKERARLLDVFTYHAPQGDQVERYALLRAYAYELACLISDLTPLGRALALALTNLETAVMFANAAIARGE